MSQMNNRIRVMLVDDQVLVRRGFSTLLAEFDDIEVVADTHDGDLAVNLCRERHPDVVLMDIHMPRMNGIDVTRLIRAACPDAQIVALSSFAEGAAIRQMLQAGAISYLT